MSFFIWTNSFSLCSSWVSSCRISSLRKRLSGPVPKSWAVRTGDKWHKHPHNPHPENLLLSLHLICLQQWHMWTLWLTKLLKKKIISLFARQTCVGPYSDYIQKKISIINSKLAMAVSNPGISCNPLRWWLSVVGTTNHYAARDTLYDWYEDCCRK